MLGGWNAGYQAGVRWPGHGGPHTGHAIGHLRAGQKAAQVGNLQRPAPRGRADSASPARLSKSAAACGRMSSAFGPERARAEQQGRQPGDVFLHGLPLMDAPLSKAARVCQSRWRDGAVSGMLQDAFAGDAHAEKSDGSGLAAGRYPGCPLFPGRRKPASRPPSTRISKATRWMWKAGRPAFPVKAARPFMRAMMW